MRLELTMNRMRLWRAKKMSREAGRLTQICVWTAERSADLVRQICTLIADPGERGENLRSVLHSETRRRRTLYRVWEGVRWKAEIDMPFVGPWWFMRNIGGRISSSDGAHVELSPEETDDLHRHLQQVCGKAIEKWAKDRKLAGVIRDHTGVLIEPPHHSEGDHADLRRPANDAEFAANEARIARAVMEAARKHRKPPFQDDSVVEYEGFHGYPSFCQIAHRKHHGRVQFALIHMPHGGTSPTNMIESLATHFRQQFYPKVAPALIDWFDVVPPDTYDTPPFHGKLTIHPVTLQHANGVYRDPAWDSGDHLPQDWIDFVAGIIERSRKIRQHLEAASHQLQNA